MYLNEKLPLIQLDDEATIKNEIAKMKIGNAERGGVKTNFALSLFRNKTDPLTLQAEYWSLNKKYLIGKYGAK